MSVGGTLTQIGTDSEPLRVAIVGSGPAGFYAAEHLLKRGDLAVQVDMFDRLPTPFGLVRFGVAPDHQKIKKVIRVYDKVASDERFQFFGNVDIGDDIELAELKQHYHQICFATGAQTDRRLGIPGEDLGRSHPATEFVAWYNGHPEYSDYHFDLSVERVAVVGVGNVAVDVARILCRTPEELAKTDIADYALEALSQSRVREVFVVGRRGAAQAAFTNAEIRELGEMEGADLVVLPEEVELDPLSQADVDGSQDKALVRKVDILQQLATADVTGKEKRLTLRFLVSPVEIRGDDDGNVSGMRLVKNELYRSDDGSLRPRSSDSFEDLPVDMVFRSVGYRGVAIPDLPFNESWGVVPNEKGRVLEHEGGEPLAGLYVAGWIKRGPSGVIGTNKPDAVETVGLMLEDVAAERTLRPENTDRTVLSQFVSERQPNHFSYGDWKRLDQLETGRGEPDGRPRVKFTSVAEMLANLERDPS
ncbi:MAG: FAD-dependent oxidoreductase [Gemmatimonadota bacterium]|nr:MAG: FAD-dependent oxidoreductase [Gemmatimonadota bacterium]